MGEYDAAAQCKLDVCENGLLHIPAGDRERALHSLRQIQATGSSAHTTECF
jgi:hypothetical protein